MIVVMKKNCTSDEIDNVCMALEGLGLGVHRSTGQELTIIGIIGDKRKLEGMDLLSFGGVEKLVPIADNYKLANKKFKSGNSIINVDGIDIGGKSLVLMAGPCAIESFEQLLKTGEAIRPGGTQILRGGAYKPRTSPYSFQGLEEEGLKYMYETKQKTGLKVITEVISPDAIEKAEKYVDMLQIGARNMQNFYLLKEAGKSKKPVLLKRGLSSTIEELLNAAEYIMSEGNPNVVLCERGIRTFETSTRNTLDISAVPVIKSKSHLPVIIDPSHACGVREYIESLALASIAAGADGLMIEVHPEPKKALSDGPQSLTPHEYLNLCKKISAVAKVVNREFLGRI